jgi:hypothetical protein
MGAGLAAPAYRLCREAALPCDYNQPNALLGQQVSRLGAGWNATRRDRTSGFLSLALLRTQEEAIGLAGELTVPVSGRFAGRLMAHTGGLDGHNVYGFAAGGRYLFGSGRDVRAGRGTAGEPRLPEHRRPGRSAIAGRWAE